MRGDDQQQNHMFSYLSPEARVRKDHPLRAIRAMVDDVLSQLSPRFDTMYARVGRPSIAPEKLLRAQLLQMLYSIRSERLLMEEMGFSPSRAQPTTWCACGIWPSQFRRCKSGPTCVWSSIELEPEVTTTPEIQPFDIAHDEQ